MKNQKGITLVALVVTVIILIILAGVSIVSLTGNETGIINKTKEEGGQAQKESIIEKIEADLYTEKIKKGKNITKAQAEAIISKYGQIKDAVLTTTEGGYEIPLSEIIGWERAEN